MEQRNSYTPRHAVPDRKGYPEAPPKRGDPEVQAQIWRYQAQKRRKQAKRRRLIRGTLVLALLVILIVATVMIAKGLRRDELKGVWALDQTTVYEFDGKGSGTLHLPLGSYAFAYTIEDNCLAIDFADEQATDAAYRYSVEDTVLKLNGENGSVFRLEKQK